ncbi:hypothetical protein ACFGVR_21875 [Mucilaginibacter sp. AW1-3]
MKKYIFAIILFTSVLAVSSCKKADTVNQAAPGYVQTVTYQFNTTVGGNYTASYTGADGKSVLEPVTATATPWSKSVAISDVTVTKSATLLVSSSTVTSGTVIVKILKNGNVVSSTSSTFTSSSHDVTTTYTF